MEVGSLRLSVGSGFELSLSLVFSALHEAGVLGRVLRFGGWGFRLFVVVGFRGWI